MPDPIDGKLGYTNDGKVFYIAMVDMGGPTFTQVNLTWEPTMAIDFANKMHSAAMKAQEVTQNDSPGTDKSEL